MYIHILPYLHLNNPLCTVSCSNIHADTYSARLAYHRPLQCKATLPLTPIALGRYFARLAASVSRRKLLCDHIYTQLYIKAVAIIRWADSLCGHSCMQSVLECNIMTGHYSHRFIYNELSLDVLYIMLHA